MPTAPPTTQLMWLKDNKVDLALGVMINPGAQPTYKEMVRLDMGPDQTLQDSLWHCFPRSRCGVRSGYG